MSRASSPGPRASPIRERDYKRPADPSLPSPPRTSHGLSIRNDYNRSIDSKISANEYSSRIRRAIKKADRLAWVNAEIRRLRAHEKALAASFEGYVDDKVIPYSVPHTTGCCRAVTNASHVGDVKAHSGIVIRVNLESTGGGGGYITKITLINYQTLVEFTARLEDCNVMCDRAEALALRIRSNADPESDSDSGVGSDDPLPPPPVPISPILKDDPLMDDPLMDDPLMDDPLSALTVPETPRPSSSS
jgi:hypothetical protein